MGLQWNPDCHCLTLFDIYFGSFLISCSTIITGYWMSVNCTRFILHSYPITLWSKMSPVECRAAVEGVIKLRIFSCRLHGKGTFETPLLSNRLRLSWENGNDKQNARVIRTCSWSPPSTPRMLAGLWVLIAETLHFPFHLSFGRPHSTFRPMRLGVKLEADLCGWKDWSWAEE